MNTKTIFAIAVLIRVIIMPFFYHPDMKSQYFHFQFLSKGHLNIYQYLSDNKKDLPYKDTFNYLPLTYFTFGTFHSISKPFLPPDFSAWLNDWSATQNSYPNFPYYLFILKVPYLILDVLVAILLYKISKSRQILSLWLFNPLSIYLIYILGNFDILPVFLTLLSFYLLRSRPNLSFLIFGLAIALKLYPLIFLPFFIINSSKNITKIIKYSLLSLIPLVLSIIPFINNSAFWQSFLGSGLTQKIIELKYFNIPIFPAIYIVILLTAFLSKKLDLPKSIFYIFLLFISTVHFHPQWLLWFLPFIFLLINFNTKIFISIFSANTVLVLMYIFLFNDNYLTWGHFIPIDPEYLNLSSPYNIFRYRFLVDPQIIQNNIKLSIAAVSTLFFVIYEKYLSRRSN